MAGRLTIGLRYRRKDQWVGGIYYVQNLVAALRLLPARQRPRRWFSVPFAVNSWPNSCPD